MYRKKSSFNKLSKRKNKTKKRIECFNWPQGEFQSFDGSLEGYVNFRDSK